MEGEVKGGRDWSRWKGKEGMDDTWERGGEERKGKYGVEGREGVNIQVEGE